MISKLKEAAAASFVRKVFKPLGRDWVSDVHTLSMDPTGDLLIGVSRAHDVFIASLASSKNVEPVGATPDSLTAAAGTPAFHVSDLAFSTGTDGSVLVRVNEELQLWLWNKGKLTLAHRAKWNIGKKGGLSFAYFDGAPRCTPTQVASLVRISKPPKGDASVEWKDRVIAVWERAKLPKATKLDGNARETKPALQLPLEKEYGDVSFELSASGEVTLAESTGYQETAVTRFDAKGKQLARTKLEFGVTDLALLGPSIVVSGSEGELALLDEKLKVVKRVKAFPRRAVSVRATVDGTAVVATCEKEIAAFTADGLKKVAKLAVKGLHDFRAHAVSSSGAVLTNNPPGLFQLS
ncbi:MAG: hypothetical protein QM817_25500 [Archangium sp.]